MTSKPRLFLLHILRSALLFWYQFSFSLQPSNSLPLWCRPRSRFWSDYHFALSLSLSLSFCFTDRISLHFLNNESQGVGYQIGLDPWTLCHSHAFNCSLSRSSLFLCVSLSPSHTTFPNRLVPLQVCLCKVAMPRGDNSFKTDKRQIRQECPNGFFFARNVKFQNH